jgi:membrane protein DedA with SNARE-associated domain
MLDWITDTISRLGYFGIGLLMFAENIFPPIPSELIMPLAGYTASQGAYWLPGVIAAGVTGTMLGALPWYWAGRYFGTEKLQAWAGRWGKYFGIRPQDIVKADAWFDRYDHWIVLVGRLIPGVRTLISVPAGCCGMPFWQFFFFSLIGSAIWCTALATAGMMLGEHYTLIEKYIAPVSKIALGLILIAGIGFVLHRRSRRSI